MLNRLLEALEGKLTTEKWAKLTKSSHDTALRDIQDLIRKGILKQEESGGRSTAYTLVCEQTV
jgi:Fic family protein